MDKNNLLSHESLNDLILFKWEDGFESYINLKILREKCPCANCEGEKAIFGNIYKGPPQIMNDKSYLISGIQPVGYYAIRPFWKDGHSDGIYSYKFLWKLCESFDSSS